MAAPGDTMHTPHIEATDPQGADALALLHEAAVEVRAMYPELHAPDDPPPGNPPLAPRGAYVLARVAGEPAGCGALRPIGDADDIAELRRMFVRARWRRRGVARALLAHLEGLARQLGYRCMRLETGNRQHAAMALYAACGYRRIAAFGAYAGDPTSVCFEKPLATALAAPCGVADTATATPPRTHA